MKKKMLEVRELNGRTEIDINYSSLSVLQECQRKSDFMFNRGLIFEGSQDQKFGEAIHKTLQAWYLTPKENRSPEVMQAAWSKFYKESGHVPKDERKTEKTGSIALHNYATTFQDDDFTVISVNGGSAVELTLSAVLYEDEKFKINYFGTVDLVVKSKRTGSVYALDHKTTTALGEQFFKLWNPNHQVSGYIWLLQQHGIECSEALIQGIQVVKTKQEVCRVESRRSPEQIQEFRKTVVSEVVRYLENGARNFFPGASDYVCGAFSGCQFQDLCMMGREQREKLIEIKQRELLEAQNADSTIN